jgi:Tol biopolymer transport system component
LGQVNANALLGEMRKNMENHPVPKIAPYLLGLLIIASCAGNHDGRTQPPTDTIVMTQAMVLLSPSAVSLSPTITPTIFPPFAKLPPGQYVVYYGDISGVRGMYAVSPTTGIQEKYTSFSGMPVSADGTLFRWGNLIYNSATGNILDISSVIGDKQCGIWSSSPDEEKFTLDCDGELYVLSLDSGAMIKISVREAEDDYFHSPLWSPDGKWISYIRIVQNPDYAPGGEVQLFLVDASCIDEPSTCPKKTKGPIRGNFSMAAFPHGWSPDSRYLAFPALDSGILIYDIQTGQIRTLPYYSMSVAWSPDGKWLAFSGPTLGNNGTTFDVFLVTADGGEPIQLTNGSNDGASTILFWVNIE